jgi:hypothetical protein
MTTVELRSPAGEVVEVEFDKDPTEADIQHVYGKAFGIPTPSDVNAAINKTVEMSNLSRDVMDKTLKWGEAASRTREEALGGIEPGTIEALDRAGAAGALRRAVDPTAKAIGRGMEISKAFLKDLAYKTIEELSSYDMPAEAAPFRRLGNVQPLQPGESELEQVVERQYGVADEATTTGERATQSMLQGAPLPLRVAGTAATTFADMAPDVGIAMLLQSAGVPAPVTFSVLMGSNPRTGFDPKGAFMGAAIPLAGKLGGALLPAAAKKYLGAHMVETLDTLQKLGHFGGALTPIAADTALEIEKLPEDERKEAWITAVGEMIGVAGGMMGPLARGSRKFGKIDRPPDPRREGLRSIINDPTRLGTAEGVAQVKALRESISKSPLPVEDQIILNRHLASLEADPRGPIPWTYSKIEGGQHIRWNPRSQQVEIDPDSMVRWFDSQRSRGMRDVDLDELVKRLVDEEATHSLVTDAEAKHAAALATSLEQRLMKIVYKGDPKAEMSPLEMGHELIRYYRQQASGMKPTELAEMAIGEKIKVQMLDAVARILSRSSQSARGYVKGVMEAEAKNLSEASQIVQDKMAEQSAAKQEGKVISSGQEKETLQVTKPITGAEPTEPTTVSEPKSAPAPTSEVEGYPAGSDRVRYLSEEERRAGMTKEIADLQAAAAMYRERGEDGLARTMDGYAAQVQKSLDELGQQSFPGGSNARTELPLGGDGDERGMALLKSYRLASAQKASDKLRYQDDIAAAGKKPQPGEDEPSPFEPGGSMRVAEALKRAQAAEERRARKAAEIKSTDMFPGMFREALAPGIPKEERALPENAYFKATPEKIEETAKAAFDIAFKVGSVPSFDKFAAGVRSGFGESITPGQIHELWQDTVWKELRTASGKDLESLVDQLQIARKLVKDRASLNIPDAAGAPDATIAAKALDVRTEALKVAERMNKEADRMERPVAQAKPGEFDFVNRDTLRASNLARAKALREKAEQIVREARNYEETGEITNTMAEQSEFFGTLKDKTPITPSTPSQNIRSKAIAEIGLALAERSQEAMKPKLKRSDIGVDDIRWEARGESPWFSIQAFELDDPKLLGRMLTEGAASDASTGKTISGGRLRVPTTPLPRTATKRLVAMLDKSGRVHLVSAYRHTRNGPSLLDPLSRAGEHIPLENLLRRGYRPIYSALLDEPVQNFHKVYKNIAEFNDKLARDANDRATQSRSEIEDVVNEAPEPIEGTEGVTPVGVGGVGPERKVAEAIAGESPGAIESRSRITPAEAQSVVDTIGQAKDSGEAAQIVDRIVGKMEGRRNVVSADAYDRVANLYDRLVDLNLRRTRTLSDATEKKLAKQIEETQQQIDKLEGVTEQGAITPQERLFINAMAKAARAKQRSMPEEVLESQTDPYLKSEVVTDLWEAAKEGPRFLEEFFSGNRPAELATKPFVSPTARELVAPRAAATIKGVGRGLREQTQRVAAERVSAAEAKAQERALRKAKKIRETPMEPSEQERRTAEMQKIIEDVEREIAAEAAAGEGPGASVARAMRASAGYASDVVTDFFSFWDEHMIPRLARQGGPESKRLAAEFYKIQDQTKKNLGSLSPVLDPALQATGGSKMIPLLGNVPSPKNIRAVRWLNNIDWTTDTAGTARTVGAMESTINPRLIPAWARDVIQKMQTANIAIGGILQSVIPGFLATGKFARNLTGEGYDLLLRGAGEGFDNWVKGLARANNMPEQRVRDFMREWKEKLVSPTPDMAEIERINQDFHRVFPKVITHIKTSGYLGMKHLVEVVHSDPFNYLRMAAVRASHVKAFRQSYPPNTAGKDRFAEDVAKARIELSDNGNEFSGVLEGITRTLQGRPTDVYKEGLLAPGSNAAYAFRWANATVGNTLARMVLSGQMLVQPGETVAGSTPAWLGYHNTMRAAARLKHLYAQMEQEGMVNRVMYDWTYNPNAKVRSAFRQLQAGLSKAAAEQLLNEVQEGMAGATAYVTAERIMAGTLSRWERRQLPETFRAMGFTPAEVNRMMAGDAALLGRFKRTAAMWLTTGNKLVGESSKLGANRRYNSIFRFSSYPMMRLQHFRKATSGMLDAFANDTPNKMAATEQFLRIAGFGALQGALTVAVGDLVMSAVSGSADPLRKRKAEAVSNPAEFIFESALASIGGPLYLLYRGASKGVGGMANSLARMAFPFAVGQDLVEAFSDTGRYRDMSTIDRIGKFLAGKTPAVKVIGPALARAGWGHADPLADNAISAYFSWIGDQEGGAERMRFREHMKAMVNAKRKGDYKKADELMQKALGAATEFAEPGKEGQAVAASLRGRKILRNKDGGQLTDEQRADFIKKKGQAAYDKLEALDQMLDALAEEAMLP